MRAGKQDLWLFTMRFPHGTGEAFLENELPVLCERFQKVVILPMFPGEGQRPLPPNAEVVHAVPEPYRGAGVVQLLRWWSGYRALMKSLKKDRPNNAPSTVPRAMLRSRARQAIQRAGALQERMFRTFDPQHTVLYSYWTHDWITVLGLLAMRDPRIRPVSRAHGFDLYEERAADGWIPFRHFQMEHVDRIFCVSQAGLDHLNRRYPGQHDRFLLARLGTTDHGLAPWSPVGTLRLVSCSNLVPLKRVDLLIEALHLTTVPVEWTHFGGGPEQERLRALSATLPPNVRCQWKGAVTNREILEHYRTNPVDLFAHMSSTEGGVPVALQEAASFGIPLLAADVGGVGEIVGPATGILLPAEPSAAQVAAELDRFLSGPFSKSEARLKIRAAWSASYRAAANFGHFCDLLLRS